MAPNSPRRACECANPSWVTRDGRRWCAWCGGAGSDELHHLDREFNRIALQAEEKKNARDFAEGRPSLLKISHKHTRFSAKARRVHDSRRFTDSVVLTVQMDDGRTIALEFDSAGWERFMYQTRGV